uniref:PDZ domain-containing protein n=1 Tax=Oryzias latipes TaxID=8090 RepID=A0A3P9I7P7_ORYLA
MFSYIPAESLSPYIFKKQSNSICCSDDVVEKGETDSLRKENIPLGFEEKEADSSAPPEGKRFKHGCGWTLFPGYGAAEEAGLMVGDYVLAVNGVDVTSIPHSEAANLARQGTPRSADLRIYRSPASFSVKLSLGDKQ